MQKLRISRIVRRFAPEFGTIVMSAPNAFMKCRHHRMAVILPDEAAVDRWLDPVITDGRLLMPMLKTDESLPLAACPASGEALAKRNDATCIEPIDESLVSLPA